MFHSSYLPSSSFFTSGFKFLIGLCMLLILQAYPTLLQGQSVSEVNLNVNPADTSSWTVSKLIYGKFHEHNGKDAYPGLYAQHLANSSFEEWFHLGNDPWQNRTAILYQDTEEYSGLAYPWEPHIYDESGKSKVNGGPHGSTYQELRVSGGSRAGIYQRLALPDQRTKTFDLHFFAKGTIDTMRIEMQTYRAERAEVEPVALTEHWTEYHVQFDVSNVDASRYKNTPFGRFVLIIRFEGDGNVGLDGLRLMSGDAVRGKYNPTTIELLKEYNVTSLRWPGGNWASAYHWRDGVGPLESRPVRHNVAWGGLEPNFMGTNEFLEFCEVAGITPYLNIGFNSTIGPQEAADWVEYVNGSTDTEMGQLRASHGHPEPYDVQHWQVGNETYGPYQEGHTNAQDFAQRFVDHYDAMKAVDPDITIIASGIDPLYVDYDENWNKTLFRIAGNKVDGVDIHRYVRGIVVDNNRSSWEEQIYNRNLVSFPTMYEQHVIREVRQSAAERGNSDALINVGEWNLQPIVSSGWERADYPTMAHAAFVAGIFNTFTRQGDAVQYSYQRDNTLYYRPFPIDTRPVNPGNYVSKYYAEPFQTDHDWHQVDVSNDSPTFFAEAAGIRQTDTDNVPYVDASSIRSANGNKLYVFVTNRNLQDPYDVNISIQEDWKIQSAQKKELSSTDPFREQTSWTFRNGFNIDSAAAEVANNTTTVRMSPASVVRLEMNVADTATAIAGNNPQLPNRLSLGQNYPNPFNPATTIPYSLPKAAKVKVEVFNVMGQKVATLLNQRQQAGKHTVRWSAGNASSGIYYYKITMGAESRVQSMTLVK